MWLILCLMETSMRQLFLNYNLIKLESKAKVLKLFFFYYNLIKLVREAKVFFLSETHK